MRQIGNAVPVKLAQALAIEIKKHKKTGKERIKSIKTNGAIILLHGLNEKDWNKYLPWAYKLMKLTGKQVVLFPIAFHMNRSPAKWIDPRFLRTANKERKQIFPKVANSSFANIALSARHQFAFPTRVSDAVAVPELK